MTDNTFRDDKYTPFLPEQLRERYRSIVTDPQLLQLRKEIGLADLRTQVLLEKLDRDVIDENEIKRRLLEDFTFLSEQEATRIAAFIFDLLPDYFVDGETFKSLQKYADAYDVNITKRNLRIAAGNLDMLFKTIRQRNRQGDMWDAIQKTMEMRRKLVHSEQDRLESMGRMIAIERVVDLLAIVIESLRESVARYVLDEETQNYIIVDAERIYNRLLSTEEDSQ